MQILRLPPGNMIYIIQIIQIIQIKNLSDLKDVYMYMYICMLLIGYIMNGSVVGIDDPCDVWSVSVRKMILVNPSVSASLNASFVLSPCAELLWSDFALL